MRSVFPVRQVRPPMQVQIPIEDREGVRKLSKALGRPMTELVRLALGKVLDGTIPLPTRTEDTGMIFYLSEEEENAVREMSHKTNTTFETIFKTAVTDLLANAERLVARAEQIAATQEAQLKRRDTLLGKDEILMARREALLRRQEKHQKEVEEGARKRPEELPSSRQRRAVAGGVQIMGVSREVTDPEEHSEDLDDAPRKYLSHRAKKMHH